jgi:transcriptional antiterminator NusG
VKVGEEDVVEIMGGPFKGEKGKIKRVDKSKNEVTIELLEASIPIPVTIAMEFIKVIKRSAKAAV